MIELESRTTNRSAICFRRVKSFTQRLHLLGSYSNEKPHLNKNQIQSKSLTSVRLIESSTKDFFGHNPNSWQRS